MQLALLYRCNGVAQHSASSSQTCRLCLFKFLRCNCAKEIGSTDNADNAPAAQHRYTLNAMAD